jgi:predicted Zn-dependent protease
MLKHFMATIVIVTLGLALWSCVTNSEGRKSFIMVGESQMNSMGVSAYSEVINKARAEGRLLPKSSERYEIVERIGKRIAQVSGADFKWEFNVIDEPKTVNAFCLPGGKIAVYTGIMPVSKIEAALAVVMGHEVAHATMRHGAERMSQQLAVAGLASVAEISLRDNRHRSLWMGALALGAQFGVILPYSRSHESEADEVGLKYAARAGYDPSTAPALWDRMGASGKSPPEFLSTHPDPANRSRALAEMQSKVRPLWESSDQQKDKQLPQG